MEALLPSDYVENLKVEYAGRSINPVIVLAFVLAVALTISGFVLIWPESPVGNFTIEFPGNKIASASIGLGVVFLGVVSFVYPVSKSLNTHSAHGAKGLSARNIEKGPLAKRGPAPSERCFRTG